MLNKEELEALKKKLQDGSAQIVSDTFNDNTHSIWAQKPIAELKFEPRIAKKLFFPLLMAFPFDPLKGAETEEYNVNRKYSTMDSPEDIMQLIKSMCNEDETLKKYYIRQAGFKGEWDTSDLDDVYTDADKQILWRYRRRMTYAFPSIKVISNTINGDKFPTLYLLNSKQDPITGEFIGELSFMHRIAAMVGAMCKREIDSFNNAIETKDIDTISRTVGRSFALSADYLKNIPSVDHNDAKARRGDIKNCYPFASPSPFLATVGMMFNITPITGTVTEQVGKGQYRLYDHFTNTVDYKKHVFFTAKYDTAEVVDGVIGNYYPKNPKNMTERNAAVDLYANFCVLDFITEDTRQTLTKDEKMEAARKTQYATEKKPLYTIEKGEWSHNGLEDFYKNISGFFTYAQDEDLVEEIRRLLTKSYKYVSPSMEASAIREVQNKFPLSSPLYDDTIKVTHASVLLEVFPEEMAQEGINLQDKMQAEGEELYKELLDKEVENAVDGKVSDEEENDDFFTSEDEVDAEEIG